MKDKLTLRFKAKLVLLALTLLTFGRAQAQVSFHLGGTLGPQFTNLKSDYGTYTGVLGYYAGATTEMRFGKYFSTQLDILYSVQGAERSFNDSFYLQNYYTQYNNYATTDMLSYLQPHLLFKFNIPLVGQRIMPYDLPENNPSSLSFFAGPYFGYLMGFSRSGSINTAVFADSIGYRKLYSETKSGAPTDAEKEGIFKTDFGVTFGLAVNFGISDNGTITVGGRYSSGFSSVDNGYYGSYALKVLPDGTPKRSYKYANITNQSIAFMLGYTYKLF